MVTAWTHASFVVVDRADVAGTRDTFELDLGHYYSVVEDLADWGLRTSQVARFAAQKP